MRNTLRFLHSKPTCLKQSRWGKFEDDIIKFKNIFDVTWICRIHNLRDSLEKDHNRNASFYYLWTLQSSPILYIHIHYIYIYIYTYMHIYVCRYVYIVYLIYVIYVTKIICKVSSAQTTVRAIYVHAPALMYI